MRARGSTGCDDPTARVKLPVEVVAAVYRTERMRYVERNAVECVRCDCDAIGKLWCVLTVFKWRESNVGGDTCEMMACVADGKRERNNGGENK